MKLGPMNITLETWTPEKAQDALSSQNEDSPQRRRRRSAIKRYARDMAAGKWELTHQAIAFGPDGALIDGQHRLAAVVESETSQPFLTVRFQAQAAATAALGAVDIGAKRTVGEVLAIDGTLDRESAREQTAITAMLASMLGYQKSDMTVDETRSVYKACAEHVVWIAGLMPRRTQSASIRAAFAFAHMIYPVKTEDFAARVISGVGEAGSTAAQWHKLHAAGKFAVLGGGDVQRHVARLTLRMIRAHIEDGLEMQKLYSSEAQTVEWFIAKARKLNIKLPMRPEL